MIKVGVLGAKGRMGSLVGQTVRSAGDLELSCPEAGAQAARTSVTLRMRKSRKTLILFELRNSSG